VARHADSDGCPGTGRGGAILDNGWPWQPVLVNTYGRRFIEVNTFMRASSGFSFFSARPILGRNSGTRRRASARRRCAVWPVATAISYGRPGRLGLSAARRQRKHVSCPELLQTGACAWPKHECKRHFSRRHGRITCGDGDGECEGQSELCALRCGHLGSATGQTLAVRVCRAARATTPKQRVRVRSFVHDPDRAAAKHNVGHLHGRQTGITMRRRRGECERNQLRCS